MQPTFLKKEKYIYILDFSLESGVLCYSAASFVSLVGVLVIGNSFDQRVIWHQSFHESNCVRTVFTHLFRKMKNIYILYFYSDSID